MCGMPPEEAIFRANRCGLAMELAVGMARSLKVEGGRARNQLLSLLRGGTEESYVVRTEESTVGDNPFDLVGGRAMRQHRSSFAE
jgi:hypothetical protein